MKRMIVSAALLSLSASSVAQNCEDTTQLTPINQVQGTQLSSELEGQTVTIRGVATSNWTAKQELGGFFVQSLNEHQDDDPLSSEGLFIDTAGQNDTVKVGEIMQVTGQVAERQGLTLLTNISSVYSCGDAGNNNSVSPARLVMPFDSTFAAESVEGMVVRVEGDKPLTISGHYPLPRYGIFDVSAGRLWNPTQVARPGSAAKAQAKSNALNRLQVDDNRSVPPASLPHQQLFHGPQDSLRSGATVKPMLGILSQFRDHYQLQPLEPVSLASRARITPIVPKAANDIRIASFNVLNFFNGNGQGGGFPTPRGAENAEQLARQQAKIVAALDALDADVFGIMEVENDGFGEHSAIQQLVSALNAAQSTPYAIAQPRSERVGEDQISVALIYNQQRFRPSAHALTLAKGPFQRGSRVPLAQTLIDQRSGQPLTIVVNHFKSKGGCPDEGVNANKGDGQACWNALRVESAQRLTEWLSQQQLPSAVLLGDFNAYYQEDPIQHLIQQGFRNVSSADDYSYVYDSLAGALDHVLVADDGLLQVNQVQHINFNADEPAIYDYRDATYYEPGPYRSSDHDPVVVDVSWSSLGK